MPVTEKILDLASLLKSRGNGVTRRELERRWNCSPATVHRVVAGAREPDGLRLPILCKNGVYRLAPGGQVELPGVWFRPEELAALLGLAQWMESLGAGILRESLEPLRARLEEMLRGKGLSIREWKERIRLLPMHFRPVGPEILTAVAGAVLQRKRLTLEYRGARDAGFRSRRVSPQTLLRYRDNWYVDVYDHDARGLRCLALNRMKNMRVLPDAAKDVAREKLDAHFAGPYGIFGGRIRGKAVLVFEGEAARIAGEERWHPKEKRSELEDGRLRLEFPCGDVRELARDVMRFADEVTVEGPEALREAVAGMVRGAARKIL